MEEYRPEEETQAHNAHNTLAKDQRPLVGLFIILFAGISIVGLQGITRNITDPFARKDGSKPIPLEELSRDTEKEKSNIALKSADTDKDGLSDYDEINIYGTSAFLDDSDGDGYDDRTEIRTGHDPLCNETTQVCGPDRNQLSSGLVSTSTENIPKFNSGILGLDGKPSGRIPFLESGAAPDFLPAMTVPGFDRPMTIDELRNLPPQEIRDFFQRQGIPQAELKKIDDDTLKKIYDQGFDIALQRVEKEQATSGGGPSLPIFSPPSQKQPAAQQKDFNPETMTVEQLRDLLRKSGRISESDLQKISDDMLKKLAQEALQEIKK